MALQNPLPSARQTGQPHNPPAATAGLTTADLARLRQALDSSVSDNNQAMYNSARRSFQTWTEARGVPALLAAYLSSMAEERRLTVATPIPPTTKP